MRSALPLAFILLAATAPAAAGPCSVPMRSERATTDMAPLDESAPECRTAAALLPDFERLRAAAGFNAETFVFRIEPDTDAANSAYNRHAVFITRASLLEDRPRASRLATLAHEIGHADQEAKGLFAWWDEPFRAFLKRTVPMDQYDDSPEKKEELRRSVIIEAHADAVGQELLGRAGYDPGLVAEGRAWRGGCGNPAGLNALPRTHPVNAQRIVNAVLAGSAAAAAKSSHAARRTAEALTPAASTPAVPPQASAAAPTTFQAAASIHDFDDLGRLKPGRLAAAPLRLPPPPTHANPARKHAQLIAGSVMDYWIADPFERAVERLMRGDGIGAEIISAWP